MGVQRLRIGRKRRNCHEAIPLKAGQVAPHCGSTTADPPSERTESPLGSCYPTIGTTDTIRGVTKGMLVVLDQRRRIVLDVIPHPNEFAHPVVAGAAGPRTRIGGDADHLPVERDVASGLELRSTGSVPGFAVGDGLREVHSTLVEGDQRSLASVGGEHEDELVEIRADDDANRYTHRNSPLERQTTVAPKASATKPVTAKS